jgi:hypothetical protein
LIELITPAFQTKVNTLLFRSRESQTEHDRAMTRNQNCPSDARHELAKKIQNVSIGTRVKSATPFSDFHFSEPQTQTKPMTRRILQFFGE